MRFNILLSWDNCSLKIYLTFNQENFKLKSFSEKSKIGYNSEKTFPSIEFIEKIHSGPATGLRTFEIGYSLRASRSREKTGRGTFSQRVGGESDSGQRGSP